MAKRKAAPLPAIDPRSPEIVLVYQGGRLPRFVPARDLHGGELARIVYRRAFARADGKRPDPPTAADIETLALDLGRSGCFARNRPVVATAPDSDDSPSTALPDPPADQEA